MTEALQQMLGERLGERTCLVLLGEGANVAETFIFENAFLYLKLLKIQIQYEKESAP